MGEQFDILQNEHAVLQEELWELVEKWRAAASRSAPELPHLNGDNVVAFGQGLHVAIEDLTTVLSERV